MGENSSLEAINDIIREFLSNHLEIDISTSRGSWGDGPSVKVTISLDGEIITSSESSLPAPEISYR